MRRTWLAVACFSCLAMIAGCTRASTYTELLNELIQAQKELTEVLADVKDAASMKAARPELKKRYSHFEQIRKKFQALPKPSQEIKEKLEDELGADFNQSLTAMLREAQRIQDLPGGKEFIARLKLQR